MAAPQALNPHTLLGTHAKHLFPSRPSDIGTGKTSTSRAFPKFESYWDARNGRIRGMESQRCNCVVSWNRSSSPLTSMACGKRSGREAASTQVSATTRPVCCQGVRSRAAGKGICFVDLWTPFTTVHAMSPHPPKRDEPISEGRSCAQSISSPAVRSAATSASSRALSRRTCVFSHVAMVKSRRADSRRLAASFDFSD